ncbi:MAG: ATP-binding response regulator [Anaerolineae bacterium]
MKREPGTLPSLVWRVAIRFVLVFAIQVLVLGILVLVAPRFIRGLGDLVVDSRRAVFGALLDDNAEHLAETATLLAASPDAGALAAAQAVAEGEQPQRWVFVVREGVPESTAVGELPAWLAATSGDLVARLEATASTAGLAWAYTLNDGHLYAAGGHRLADSSGSWLIVVADSAPVLQQAVDRLAPGEDAAISVVAGTDDPLPSLSYGTFMRGVLPVTIAVPNAVGAAPIEVRFTVPVLRLAYIFRAGTLIFAASFLLLAGSLLLAFLSTYSQVMQPFTARLRALSQYALTGVWEAPPGGYREHQLANDAITQAVHARELAEREAQQRMAELRTFMDSLPAHVVVKDVDLKFRLVNEAFCRFLGRTSEELLGKTDADIFPEALVSAYGEHDREVLRLGRPQHYEEEGYLDGAKRIYRVVKAPISEADGSISGIVGIAIDITEQKDLEGHLVEAQKMQVVGRLAGGLSHAFNNLLTAIIGSAELAMLSMKSDDPAREEVQQIRKAAERGGDLSRQLLTLSRQRLAKMTIIDANRLVDEMLPVLRETLGDDIVVETDLAVDAPPVKADPTQLRQVILNLAINAGEAMPSGGSVRIATLRCEAPKEAVTLEPMLGQAPVLCLSVEDRGMGMSAEVKPHVFEPFFTTKGASQGRGLGLPVAYSIVRQHKGVILYESEEGKGTEFTVFMPAVEAEPVAEPRPQSHFSEVPRGREVVLLVEDDGLVRQLAERLLVAQGYTVWTADSGERALAILEESGRDPDLLLTDVIMPGISGVELARTLQRQRPRVRILLMSGYAGENEQGTMGGFPMLWKPFTLQVLAQRVRSILDA